MTLGLFRFYAVRLKLSDSIYYIIITNIKKVCTLREFLVYYSMCFRTNLLKEVASMARKNKFVFMTHFNRSEYAAYISVPFS